MLYYLYELNHAAMSPARAAADAARFYFRNPLNPVAHTTAGKSVAAMCELFERVTRRYGKPEFGIKSVNVNGVDVAVTEHDVWQRPFCRLKHFRKEQSNGRGPGPKLLLVAPMSGHYATLLRGTVETMLPHHDVYVTDWVDARLVPLSQGGFDLDDYVDYVISMLHALGPGANVMAVCQPSVPVLAAVSVMEANNDPFVPATMILMGGPIDTRCNPTEVNRLAEEHGLDWFERNVIVTVPFPHQGVMRKVYPGFLQLTGFMSMNLDRHMSAHYDLFRHMVRGDGDSAERHRDFYDEYLAVMDLTAEFYLQTVETVFVRHALPKGEMMHRGVRIDPSAIKRVALMTVEGELDDISGVGQTEAAHRICSSIPQQMRVHYLQPAVGHYGVFNGSRFRAEVAPRIGDFIANFRKPSTRGPSTRTVSRKGRAADQAQMDEARAAADDLTVISGIGPALQKKLNVHGIFTLRQLAELNQADIARIDETLHVRGRVGRDDWVGQARRLTAD